MLEYSPSPVIEKNLQWIIHIIQDHSDILKYRKGQTIYLEGSTPLGVYFVKSGMVKVSKLGSDGKEQVMTISVANDMLNCTDMILNAPYDTSAATMEDSELYFVPKQEFWKVLRENYELNRQFVYLMAEEHKYLEMKMTDMAYKPVRGRLADALIYLYHKSNNCNPEHPCVSISRYDLSCLVGTAKETVNRLMSEFRNDKLIITEGKKISVINPQGLGKLSHMYD